MSTKSKKTTKTTKNIISGDSKIKWVGKENPFREGSGAFLRTEFVRKSSGRTRDAIEKNANLFWSTVPNLARLGLVRVVA